MKYVDLTKEQREYLRLGEHVVEMIRTLGKVSGGDEGYARQKMTFNQGSVIVFLVKSETQAEVMERAVNKAYDVQNLPITDGSERPS